MRRREAAVLDVVRRCAREIQEHVPAAASDRTVRLRLDLTLQREGPQWMAWFDVPMAEQMREQMRDALADLGAFREGFVYCFKCASAGCAHACPGDPGDVFAGFDPMGMPEWKGFAQALLDARDPRIDRLYAPVAPMLARVQTGRELKARQLASFGRGSRAYGLLGQVIAGYVPPDEDGESGAVRTALTLQAVETFAADGTWELRLNLVSGASSTDAAWLDADRLEWLRRARSSARRELNAMQERARTARASRDAVALRRCLGEVPGLMHRLAQSLERGARQRSRRTRHAEDRRRMQRPVHMAVADALAAETRRLLADERTDGRIVCGPQGRTHVFSRNGRHVTSFVLPPGGAEARLRLGRWTPLPREDAEALQARIASPGRDREPL